MLPSCLRPCLDLPRFDASCGIREDWEVYAQTYLLSKISPVHTFRSDTHFPAMACGPRFWGFDRSWLPTLRRHRSIRRLGAAFTHLPAWANWPGTQSIIDMQPEEGST